MKSRINKKRLIWRAAAVFIILVAFGVQLIKSCAIDNCYEETQQPVVGIFDRNNPGRQLNVQAIKHYELIWRNSSLWDQSERLEKALDKNDVLVTIQPWIITGLGNQNVLGETLAGVFDRKIEALGKILQHARHTAYVRWCPDMEVPVNLFQWQFQSPQAYNAAFRYFSQKLKRLAPKAIIVWGPSGYPGDTEYWPGNKVVDMAAITMGSVSEYSTDAHPKVNSGPEMLRQKIHRLRFINKPVLIIGSTGFTAANFKQGWISDEISYINNNKQVVYAEDNYTDTGAVKPRRQHLSIGVYDPYQRLANQPEITIEHIFADLGEVQRGTFEKEFRAITARHHDVIVTMEPWKDISHLPDTNVVKSILSHRYDATFSKLFKILGSTSQTVYLRFMHEMEIPIHRYAWQSKDPIEYIAAYRYFMQFEGGPPANVKKVWGPAGDRGSIDFWPGSDVVDFISIAIYGLPDKNITDTNKQEAFHTIFNRKLYRMRFAGKPVFITEFGVKGPEDYQDRWLRDAAKTIKNNPNVFGICYFNLYDTPDAWGKIKPPDWSITPRSMQKFLKALN